MFSKLEYFANFEENIFFYLFFLKVENAFSISNEILIWVKLALSWKSLICKWLILRFVNLKHIFKHLKQNLNQTSLYANANFNWSKCIFRLKGNPIRFKMALSWKRFSANLCIMPDFDKPKLMNWSTFLFVILIKTFVVRKGILGWLEFVLSYKTFSLDVEFCAFLSTFE